jgi:mRNA-degrading endonuclease toxin of MazEF toxin-antitoxin module
MLSTSPFRATASLKIESGSTELRLRILRLYHLRPTQRSAPSRSRLRLRTTIWILTLSPDARPKRGEIWRADLGDGKKHAVVIVSLDARNLSERASSVLVIPFGSYGAEGPTVMRMEPGETGLPEPSFLKAHFIQVLSKERLLERMPRSLSAAKMRSLVSSIMRAIDPDAPFEQSRF